MDSKVRATRALAAYTATRALRFVNKIFIIVFVALTGLIGLLAIQLSNAWWLLLIPVLIVSAIVVVLRFIVRRVIHSVYPDPLSQAQRRSLDTVTDKIADIAEAQSTPPWMLALITLKDIIVHRDVSTIRKLIDDSKSISGDITELDKQFKER